MDLPTWERCSEAVSNKTATALEQFIYDHEPAAKDAADEFRAQLQLVIDKAWVEGSLSYEGPRS